MRKKLLLAIASLESLLVVQAQDNTLSYASTHPIDPTDSPSVIVRKAAHVVPTANQLTAMRDEFIAWYC